MIAVRYIFFLQLLLEMNLSSAIHHLHDTIRNVILFTTMAIYQLRFHITDRVHSTTGRLCFDTCLSVCPHRRVVPQPGPAREGNPAGGYPCWGFPTSGTPPSDLARGCTLMGGTPPWVPTPPIRPGQGVYPDRGVP